MEETTKKHHNLYYKIAFDLMKAAMAYTTGEIDYMHPMLSPVRRMFNYKWN